jgi:myosin heavy subunit
MVFMRDMMYSQLETSRARVLDKRIRGLQGWIREELKRRVWTHKKHAFIALQARQRGDSARKRVARLRLEVDCERTCEEGVTQRKLAPLEFAITEAARINHSFPLLIEAKAILDRLKDEKEVEEMLAYAVAAKDGAELERSIKAAEQLGLEALWHTLHEDDPRKGLIAKCRMLIDQLSRYDELMRGLNVAMRERTVEALKAMIVECESVELECGEVEEAREMLKMAEFEQSARRLRQEKRQMQIEAQWAKPPEPKSTAPNTALLEQQAATERRIREFEHALTAATENGEAFPGELQRLEAKIHEAKQQLQSDAMKEEENRQRIHREKAELELAKRTAARVGTLSAPRSATRQERDTGVA